MHILKNKHTEANKHTHGNKPTHTETNKQTQINKLTYTHRNKHSRINTSRTAKKKTKFNFTPLQTDLHRLLLRKKIFFYVARGFIHVENYKNFSQRCKE